jgi:hypothetical protein
MKRIITYIFCLTIASYFAACQQKMICPAYHSYFILDTEVTRKTFSLFNEDSLPKDTWKVDKEKYGIAKAKPYNKKLDELRTISMTSVYLPLEDPFEQFRRENAIAGSEVLIDSAAVLAKSRGDDDFQNIDQMIYLHHFGKYLPSKISHEDQMKEDMKTDEPLVIEEPQEDVKKEKKRKGLFGKKNKNDEPTEIPEDIGQ